MRRKIIELPFAVFCVLLSAACLLVYALGQRTAPAEKLEIYEKNTLVAVLPLCEDTVFTLDSAGMQITVENGAAFISQSACPCKTCQHFGRLTRAGQSAVCLPAGVRLTLSGRADVDAVL